MNIVVLTLAGIGKRFLDVGINMPKYLLEFKGKKIIEHICAGIKGSNIFCICVINKKDAEFEGYIKNILQIYFKSVCIFNVEKTLGQADTVRIGLERTFNCDLKKYPLFIYNGDTILSEKNINSLSSLMEINNLNGIIEVFNSISDKFSFLITDKDNIVIKIAEKKVISNHATSGFYVFSSCQDYLTCFNSLLIKKNTGEIYVSNVYNEYLSLGYKLLAIKSEKPPIILGTPEEYFSQIKNA